MDFSRRLKKKEGDLLSLALCYRGIFVTLFAQSEIRAVSISRTNAMREFQIARI